MEYPSGPQWTDTTVNWTQIGQDPTLCNQAIDDIDLQIEPQKRSDETWKKSWIWVDLSSSSQKLSRWELLIRKKPTSDCPMTTLTKHSCPMERGIFKREMGAFPTVWCPIVVCCVKCKHWSLVLATQPHCLLDAWRQSQKIQEMKCVVPKNCGVSSTGFEPQTPSKDCPSAKGWGRGKA
jgi:hypothetical protein